MHPWTIRAIVTTAAVVMVGGSRVFACPVCFAAEETSMVNGTRIGILVLLAVTLAVQGAFVGFFIYLRNRAKQIAEIELDTEWSELQRASR
jgi:heme/copper-type cytochrome/quinol oxidase subunit 2